MLATYQAMTFRSSAESTLLSYIDRRQHAKDTLSAKHPTARVPTRLFSDLISAHAFRQVARAHDYIPFSKRYTHCRAHTSQLPLQPRSLACHPQVGRTTWIPCAVWPSATSSGPAHTAVPSVAGVAGPGRKKPRTTFNGYNGWTMRWQSCKTAWLRQSVLLVKTHFQNDKRDTL